MSRGCGNDQKFERKWLFSIVKFLVIGEKYGDNRIWYMFRLEKYFKNLREQIGVIIWKRRGKYRKYFGL